MEIMKDIDIELNIDILLQQGISAHQAGYLFGFSRSAFINLPCLILDSIKRIRQSLVLGPVLAPP